MLKNNPQKTFLPQCDGWALDFIKLTGAGFMVVDHINAVLFDHQHFLMTLIGRGTFPLFCYAVAAAVLKMEELSPAPEDRKKAVLRYFARLMGLAVVSQPVFAWVTGLCMMNVIFTLAFGMLFAVVSVRWAFWQMACAYVLSIISMLWILPLEFGLAGVMLPSAFLLVRRGEMRAWPFLIVLLMFLNLGGLKDLIRPDLTTMEWVMPALNGLFAIGLTWFVLDAARNMKQDGRLLHKYALHVFYPGHLLVLKTLALAGLLA